MALSPEEIAEQMKLPEEPRPPEPGAPAASTSKAVNPETQKSASKTRKPKKPKKPVKAAASINRSTTKGRRTTEKPAGWTPPSLPAPFTSYRLPSFDARRIIYPGSASGSDAWWDMSQLIAQVEDTIRIFDFKFPDAVGVFIFDCSSAHESFAEDALRAQKMNRNPGGQQPKMHDTVIPTGPFAGQVQTMSFPNDCTEKDGNGELLAGKPKGMERILSERGILDELTRKSHNGKVVAVCKQCKQSQEARDKAAKEAKARIDEIEGSGVELMVERSECEEAATDLDRPVDCCMRCVLSVQPDFLTEKPLLQVVIEKAGHKCFFLPKFHCELNPIEMVWGHAKRRERIILCSFSILIIIISFPRVNRWDFCSSENISARMLGQDINSSHPKVFPALLSLYGCIWAPV